MVAKYPIYCANATTQLCIFGHGFNFYNYEQQYINLAKILVARFISSFPTYKMGDNILPDQESKLREC